MVTSKFVCLMFVGAAFAATDHHNRHTVSSFLATEEKTLETSLSALDHKYADHVKSFARILAPVPPSWWGQSHHAWLENSNLIQKHKFVSKEQYSVADDARSPHKPEVISKQKGSQQVLGDALITILLCALCAAIYMHFKKPNFENDLESAQESFEKWRYEWYGLPENRMDLQVCACAFLCPCIRWAETHSFVKPHHNFWLLFSAYAGCWILSRLGWFAIFSIPMMIALCVFFRCELRKRYSMKQGPDTMCFDVLLYTFCGCCAIAQEARHVERSMRVMHNAVWPPNKPTSLP